MRKSISAFLTVTFVAIPLFAGALTLQVDDLKTNPEAIQHKAVVVAHITACQSPEKTTVTAFAEGMANGKRQTLPLKVINLTAPGAFAVAHEWPLEGKWVIKMIARNPDYKDYATAVIVPIHGGQANPTAAQVFYHAPSHEETDSVLNRAAF